MVKKVHFLNWTMPNNWATIWAFCNFKMNMYLKCHVSHVIHHYLRVSVWMCKMIDAALVLGGACQRKRDRKWQWRQHIKGRRGWTEKGPMHKRCRQGQTWGGGGGLRETKTEREKERTRDASLQMRGLEARRQFKQALAPSQAWQTVHSYPLSFPHTLSQTHMQAHTYIHAHTSQSCMLAHKAIAKKIKQETLREHKCAHSRQKSFNCADAYICKGSRFSKASTPLQQKTLKNHRGETN